MIKTTGDGRCLFHSISLCLFGNENYSHLLKIANVFFLLENESYFSKVLNQQDRSLSFDQLVENNANDLVFGNHFSLMSLSGLIQRPIYSFTPFVANCLTTNPFYYNKQPVKIFLFNSHFSAILPLNCKSIVGEIPVTKNELRNTIKRKIDSVELIHLE